MKKANKKHKDINTWENVSFLLSSSWRRNILRVLESPKTPTQIRKELNMNPAHVTRTLKQLHQNKMIESLTPTKRQGKLFITAKEGKELLEKAEKIINKAKT